MNFQKILWRRIERALDTVANQIVLVALGVGGIVGILTGAPVSVCAVVIVLGFGGAVAAFYKQRFEQLKKRSQPGANARLVTTLLQEKPHWKPKIFPQVMYQGFNFNAYGFRDISFPLSVSSPLCPQCQDFVKFKPFVNWRGLIRSKGWCRRCNFKKTIDGTEQELEQEAWEMVCPIVRSKGNARHHR